jgi:hypothetical protein
MSLSTDVARSALSWVSANLSAFEVPSTSDDGFLATALKPVGELALTAEVMGRYARPDEGAALEPEALLAFCWEQTRSGELISELICRYPDLFALCTIYPPFYRAGLRNVRLEQCIRSLATLSAIQHLEFPAWRALDIATSLDSVGIPHAWSTRHLWRSTWLSRSPEPWALCEASAYSLTHTTFYLTDFGRTPAGLPRAARQYLRKWLPPWQMYYAHCGNMDLLGELIMVGRSIGTVEDEQLWSVLAQTQRADGAVPSALTTEWAESVAGGDERRVDFLTNYHTTLVTIMAAAMVA